MKKALFVPLFIILYSLFISPVHAKNPLAPGQIWQEVREEVKDEQKEVKKEVVEEVKATKGELRSDIAQIHATRLKHRFLGIYYPRLNAFIQKVQAKIESLESVGKNMTAAQSKLNEAKAALEAAQALADQSIAGFEAIEPAKYSLQRQQAIEASNQAKDARTKFVETIKLLKDTLKLMRAA